MTCTTHHYRDDICVDCGAKWPQPEPGVFPGDLPRQHQVDPATMLCSQCGKTCQEITFGEHTGCTGVRLASTQTVRMPVGKYPKMEVVPDVDEFHAKMGLCREITGPLDEFTRREFTDLAEALHDISKEMLTGSDGTGILKDRVALMIEELAEIIMGFVSGDREEIIDGHADLAYLLLGNAALYRVRLLEAVRRVHASNMSKTPGQPKPLKGEGYFKPNFEGL